MLPLVIVIRKEIEKYHPAIHSAANWKRLSLYLSLFLQIRAERRKIRR